MDRTEIKCNIMEDNTIPSIPHDKWLKKFNKSKQGELFNMLYDLRDLKANLRPYNKLSYLAAALSIACKNTKMEEDAKALIEIIYPDYYSED